MPLVTSDKLPICPSNNNLFPLLDILVNRRNNFLLVLESFKGPLQSASSCMAG